MLDEKQTTQDENELWNEANNPPEKTYDLFAQVVDMTIFKGAYQSGMRGAVPFDPNVHPKAHTIVKFYIQPLPEINVKYQEQLNYESPVWGDWEKTTFPSIKALGIGDAREISNRWFRFERVGNGKTYTKSDGTTGEEKTWKVVAHFANEDEARAAYIAAGGKSDLANGNGHNVPVTNEDAERATAFQFLKVIVQNAVRGHTDWNEAKAAVAKALEQYPTVTKFFNADNDETAQLMSEANDKILPF